MNKRSFLKGLFSGTVATVVAVTTKETVAEASPSIPEMSLLELQYKKDCEFLDKMIDTPQDDYSYNYSYDYILASIAMMNLNDTDYIKYVNKSIKNPKLFLYFTNSSLDKSRIDLLVTKAEIHQKNRKKT